VLLSLKLDEAIQFWEVPCLENGLPCFRWLTVITDFEVLLMTFQLHGNSLKNSSYYIFRLHWKPIVLPSVFKSHQVMDSFLWIFDKMVQNKGKK